MKELVFHRFEETLKILHLYTMKYDNSRKALEVETFRKHIGVAFSANCNFEKHTESETVLPGNILLTSEVASSIICRFTVSVCQIRQVNRCLLCRSFFCTIIHHVEAHVL